MKIANRANTNRARIPGPRSDQWFGFALVLPALIVLLVVIALPILKGIYVSFFSYKLKDISQPLFDFSSANIQKILAGEEGLGALSNLKWNDLANYTSLFKRGEILDYFGNTILFVLLTVSIQLVLGMIIALLLNSKHPLVSWLKTAEADENTDAECEQIVDLAEMARQPLVADRMVEFLKRSNALLTKVIAK